METDVPSLFTHRKLYMVGSMETFACCVSQLTWLDSAVLPGAVGFLCLRSLLWEGGASQDFYDAGLS